MAQLGRLADGLERIHRTLMELTRQMTEPDGEAPKLQEVLASLVAAIAANTATLQRLERSAGRGSAGRTARSGTSGPATVV